MTDQHVEARLLFHSTYFYNTELNILNSIYDIKFTFLNGIFIHFVISIHLTLFFDLMEN